MTHLTGIDDLQDFPEIPKQEEWKCKRMPDKIDWDGLIAEVLQRGTDVPEVPWFKPGEDAAYDVSKRKACVLTLLVCNGHANGGGGDL